MKKSKIRLFSTILILNLSLHASIVKSETDDIRSLIQQVSKYQSGESVEPLRKIEELVRNVNQDPVKKLKVEKILAEILASDSTIEAKKFACQQLAILGPDFSLMILSQLAALEPTAGVACMAIVNSSSTNAFEALTIAYSHGNLNSKLQAVNAIGNLDWQRFRSLSGKAESFLKARLEERERQIVEAALTSLGKIGSKSAIKTLMDFKSRSSKEFAEALSDALLRCADKAVAEGRISDARSIYSAIYGSDMGFQASRAALIGRIKTEKENWFEIIKEALKFADDRLRTAAISTIPSIRAAGVSSKISQILPDLDKDDQILIIDALAEIGDSVAINTIEKAAMGQDKDIKLAAISALGKIGQPKHAAIMVKALNETSDPFSSQIIEQSLYSLKGGDAVDAIIFKELRGSPPAKTRLINVLARRFALRSESKLLRTEIIPALLDIAKSDDQPAARAAWKALGKLSTEKDLPQLLNALGGLKSAQVRGEGENAIASIIEKLQVKSSFGKLLCEHISKSDNTDVKVCFINLLPVCGGPEALSAAKSAYLSGDPKIKEAGLRALAEWRDMSAWDLLVGVYEKPDSESFRVLALRGLVRLLNEENIRPDEKLVEKYKRLFDGAKSASDKKMIIGALGNCNHREALYLALEKISDTDIKPEAIEAVKRIANAIKNKYPKDSEQAMEKIK